MQLVRWLFNKLCEDSMVRKATIVVRDVPLYALDESAVLDGMFLWDDDVGDYSVTRPVAYGWLDDIVAGVCRLSDRLGKNELRYQTLLELFCDMPLGAKMDTMAIARRLGTSDRTARRYMAGLSIMLMVLRRKVVPDGSPLGYTICPDDLDTILKRIR